MFSNSFRSDFKILNYLQLILDFINQIYLRIRLDLIFIFRTLILTCIFYISRICKFS